MGYIIGINASRAKSGGAKSHLIGLLTNLEFNHYNINEIHVWAYVELLNDLPNYTWLIKHDSNSSNSNLFKQIIWEFFKLPNLLRNEKCDILLNLDAGSFCRFKPYIGMSRDMLSYEPGIMKKYFISFAWLRLYLLKFVQVNTLQRADSVIFLTKYASDIIQSHTKQLNSFKIINHGVSDDFRTTFSFNSNSCKEFTEIIYVSNIDLYKHQDNVSEAVIRLNQDGYKIKLNLVGGVSINRTYKRLINLIKQNNANEIIKLHGSISHNKIIEHIRKNDLFIFASSCENMPNTLIEGMASSIPILCSNRGPMPEVLGDWDYYFDPESVDSIYKAILKMIKNKNNWNVLSVKAQTVSEKYSWKRCSKETFNHIIEVADKLC